MKNLQIKLISFIALIAMLTLIVGCNPQAAAMKAATKDAKNPETAKAFEKWFYSVVDDIKKDPDYKRIPLDTQQQQEWFLAELFTAWDKKITKEQFTETVLKKYPGYEKSVAFITEKLP